VPSLPTSARLRRILLAYTVNELGTWFGYVALAVAVYDHTHSAVAVAGLLIAGRLFPALLTPALVARAEASTARGGLSRLYAIEVLTSLALAVQLPHLMLPAVLVLVAIDGTAALAANALLRAAVAHIAAEEASALSGQPGALEHPLVAASSAAPQTSGLPGAQASPEEVEIAQRKANAALNVAFTGAVTLGPALAGVFVAAAGGQAALYLDAATFAICAVLLLDVRPHIEEAAATVRERLRAAWEYLHEVPQLRALLLTEAVAVVFFASAEPIEIVFAKQTLHAGNTGFGLLLATWGLGMIAGSVFFARAVRRPLGPMLVVGTLVVGLSYIGLAAAPTLALACAACVFGGAGNSVQWPALISAVQKLTPSALQGRLMGAVESIGGLCPAIGFSLGGAVTALSSPRVALLIAGIVATGLTGVFMRVTMHGLALPDTDDSARMGAAGGETPSYSGALGSAVGSAGLEGLAALNPEHLPSPRVRVSEGGP
jgi:MFS family permease